MRKKYVGKKIFAAILAVTMGFTMMPTNVYAENEMPVENIQEQDEKETLGEFERSETVQAIQSRIDALPTGEEFAAMADGTTVGDSTLNQKQTDVYNEAQALAEEIENLSEEEQGEIDTDKLQVLFAYFNQKIDQLLDKSAFSTNSVSDMQTYTDGTLKSIKVSLKTDKTYAVAYGKIAILSASSKKDYLNPWFEGANANSWPSLDELKKTDPSILAIGDGDEFKWTDKNIHTLTVGFEKGQVDLKKAGNYYIYLCTRSTDYGIYPDCLLKTLTSKGDGKLYDGASAIEGDGHEHSWNYTVDDNVIKVHCTNSTSSSSCSYQSGHEVTLTLNASDVTYSGSSYNATMIDNISSVTGANVGAITYYKTTEKGVTTGGKLVSTPKNVGYYYAKVTVNDSVSAVKAFEITPKNLTVKVNNVSKHCGKNDPEFTYTASGIVGGDQLNGIAFSREKGEIAGIYTVTASAATDANPNYTITFESGELTITPHAKADSGITENVVSPTCTKKGTHEIVYYCKEDGCNAEVERTIVEDPALGHAWTEQWEIIKDATATKAGKKQKKCTREGCDYKKYETIPATGTPVTDPFDGKFDKDAEVTPNSPIEEGTLNNTKAELFEEIFNQTEQNSINTGNNARVWLEISDTNLNDLAEVDKTTVENVINAVMGDNKDQAVVFNADLYKKIAGGSEEKISNSNVKIKITIKIPERITTPDAGMTRTFKIIRLHAGEAQIISGVFDASTNEFSFETDKFSTYAIVYEDHPVSSSGNSSSNNSYINSSNKLDAIEKLVKDEFVKLPTEEISSKDDIASVVKKVIEASGNEAVSYEITDFVKVDPTTKSEGKVSGTIKFTLNGVSKTVPFSYTLKMLIDDSASSDIVKEPKLPLIATGKAGDKKVKLSWEKVAGTTGYEVYGCVCDGSKNFKKVADTKKLSATLKNLNNKKSYKYYVRAYKLVDGKKVYLKKSPTLHVSLKNNKSTNVKNIKTTKNSYTLNVGKKTKICATIVKEDKNKKLLAHAAELRYYSSNTSVATVSKDGTITAKAAGTCTIYVVANNGTCKKIKVIVK